MSNHLRSSIFQELLMFWNSLTTDKIEEYSGELDRKSYAKNILVTSVKFTMANLDHGQNLTTYRCVVSKKQ